MKKIKLAPRQKNILKTINEGSETAKEVQEKLGISSSNASNVISFLVAAGLVAKEQDHKDFRIFYLTITP